ncbi:MAG: PRC-barrel domain-containing protein [Parvibaculaceae bacterium]|jgi:hypothetical protein
MERAHPDHNLISSEQVEGTSVFDTRGEKIGQIDHLMIDKRTGHVIYAVMSFGGFLGMGHNHYPLPWPALTYDPHLEGYRIAIREDQLRDAPEFTDNAPQDRDWESRVHDHYGVPYYW